MSPYVHSIVTSFREAEENLTRDVRRQQRRFKQGVLPFLGDASVSNLLTTPLVYSLGLPLLLLDLWVTVYQWACFPIYGIACVPRRPCFFIDRHKLAYLNAIEKANCTIQAKHPRP